ncbi:MAG: peptidase MA domain-containing protein [Chloroflexi bacterium]|nr:peptidase MA domain-containing protein [Chloroflexota bacterium]
MRTNPVIVRGAIRWLAMVLAALVVVVSCRPLPPAATLELSASTQVAFPASMTFKILARSDADVVKLRLHYKVLRQNFAEVVSEAWPEFSPSRSIDTQWMWDMRRAGLPPGARVQYWWTAEDAAGKRLETNPTEVAFDDGRYRWQSITVGAVTLLWYLGDRAFADTLMNASQQALQRLERDTGAVPQRQVRIYIYGSAQELQGALLFPQEWTGGVSFGEFDVIAIGVAPSNLGFGLRAVPHELSHWIIGQMTFNNYGAGMPVWLDEGLATYGEGPATAGYDAMVENAARTGILISVKSLSSPFSALPDQALLSYAESRSIVAYLIQTYGRDKMDHLLDVFREGSGFDDALKSVYGFDQVGLDVLWRVSIGAGVPVPR